MNKIKKARQEIMKKAYEMMTLREEINECIVAMFEELEKGLDNKLDYDIKILESDQWVKLGGLCKTTADCEFMNDENTLIEFNRFIKNIEMEDK